MYVRMARFEGADPAVMEREIEQMRKQIRSGMSGEPADAGEQAPGGADAAQMETIRKAVKKVLVLVDRDKGSSAMLAFTDTEQDVRTIDEIFGQMNPSDAGGRRQSVDIYEVAIDEQSAR